MAEMKGKKKEMMELRCFQQMSKEKKEIGPREAQIFFPLP